MRVDIVRTAAGTSVGMGVPTPRRPAPCAGGDSEARAEKGQVLGSAPGSVTCKPAFFARAPLRFPTSEAVSVVGFRGSLESPGATVQCRGRGQQRQRRVCGKRERRAACGSEKPSGLSLGPAAFTAAARLRPRACKPRMLSYFQVGATFHEAWKAHGLRMSVPHKGRWEPSRTCLLGDRPWSLSRYQEHSSTGPVAPESREERLSPPRALCTPCPLGRTSQLPGGTRAVSSLPTRVRALFSAHLLPRCRFSTGRVSSSRWTLSRLQCRQSQRGNAFRLVGWLFTPQGCKGWVQA